jgi:virulence factor Mce-like protein
MSTVMTRFSGLTKVLTAFVVLALLLAMLVVFAGGNDTRKLTVDFESTNSLYVGSDVRILGVAVGTVDELKARGDSVRATLSYSSDVKLPDDVKAVIVSPAIVGDRFVQLTPAYSGGAVLADGARLGVERTQVPVELDEIFQSIDDLSVALGPKGANKNGALSSVIEDSADQLNGQGAQLNQTLKNFGRLSKTLSDNKDNLFGSVREVNQFVDLLQRNDDSVRAFFDSTAQVSQVLEAEREDLKGTLEALSKALIDVRTLVKENRSELRGNVDNLQRLARVLANHEDDLEKIAIGAPTALSNVAVTYNGNPGVGSLDNRSNILNLVTGLLGDPVSVFCSLLAEPVPQSGELCDGLASIVDGVLPNLSRTPAASAPAERPDRMNDSVADMLAVK